MKTITKTMYNTNKGLTEFLDVEDYFKSPISMRAIDVPIYLCENCSNEIDEIIIKDNQLKYKCQYCGFEEIINEK